MADMNVWGNDNVLLKENDSYLAKYNPNLEKSSNKSLNTLLGLKANLDKITYKPMEEESSKSTGKAKSNGSSFSPTEASSGYSTQIAKELELMNPKDNVKLQ